ncbi:MAG: ferritin family protein [Gammaproteobacteria bacterium]
MTVCIAADFTETIQALQERYQDEVEAHVSYGAFSDKALAEGYPNSAYLFKSLAVSEAIHARNFKRILDTLGVGVPGEQLQPRPVESTQSNIMHATGVEADEIDHEYPAILARIRLENHQEAIDNLTWAWEAEKQHRDLLGRMQDAAKKWFRFLIAHIEGEFVDYHVCQICGSTLVERPADRCPVCGQPASHYHQIPYVTANRTVPAEEY